MLKKNRQGCGNGIVKERHIVSWSQEEDDILRDQIRIHGTENWSIIASKFKDKTTRQCRRRWFTYLNSNFKKGGWSPEEDMLLCEAQKIFGNRWTEIAKVVSGRTDNAVKNRFTTLSKKRAKQEALAKENNSYINLNNKRVFFPDGLNIDVVSNPSAGPLRKMRRTHISDIKENFKNRENSLSGPGTIMQPPRPPLSVLTQNIQNDGLSLPTQQHANHDKDASADVSRSKSQESFLKKDDPKIIALMQQAEFLSSLALKIKSESTDQSLENAWKVLQDFLNHSKEGETLGLMDFELENFKDSIDDVKICNEVNRTSSRHPNFSEESVGRSKYSTGSSLLAGTALDKTKQTKTELFQAQQEIGISQVSPCLADQDSIGKFESGIRSSTMKNQAGILPECEDIESNHVAVCDYSSGIFSSPSQVMPLFQSIAATIPSPKFSESERQFLLKALGVETSPNPSQPPSCRRVLLHSL